jgi:hypothetical protein
MGVRSVFAADRTVYMALIWAVYFSILEILSLGRASQSSLCILMSEEQPAKDQAGYQSCATMHEAVFRFVRFIWENATHDNVIAFGTVMIAIFTFVLYRSTHRLWDVTDRTLKSTERTNEALERSRVFHGYSPLRWRDGKAEFILRMTNVGRMPGLVKLEILSTCRLASRYRRN